MRIILNEKEYAERCLREKDVGESAKFALSLIAKYDYYELGYRKQRIEKHLTQFIKEAYPAYQRDIAGWTSTIEEIARRAGKYPLYIIHGVLITQSEIDAINNATIDGEPLNKKLRQLAFTYLCLAKLGKIKNPENDGWVKYKRKDIFTMAHITASDVQKSEMIGDLALAGLLAFPRNDANLSRRVTFIDDDSKIVLEVTDFRDLGYLFLQQIGENIIACKRCGNLTRGNKAGTKKYCKDCAGYVPQEYKIITCADCGRTVRVSAKNTKTCRCDNCQREHRRAYDRERKKIPHSN